MITIAGKKMGKSYNNFITLDQFFTGSHELLSRPFSPMTIRFFILMAHYRSTVDFSNEALEAAEKGLLRLNDAYSRLQKIQAQETTNIELINLKELCINAMDDDLNTPIVISHLFDSARAINTLYDGKGSISSSDLEELKQTWEIITKDILGLCFDDQANNDTLKAFSETVNLLLQMRLEAKQRKDWETSDKIRDNLVKLGFNIKDTKNGFEWSL
jgi:cysteinyl-tRNA synthetase